MAVGLARELEDSVVVPIPVLVVAMGVAAMMLALGSGYGDGCFEALSVIRVL